MNSSRCSGSSRRVALEVVLLVEMQWQQRACARAQVAGARVCGGCGGRRAADYVRLRERAAMRAASVSGVSPSAHAARVRARQ
eukprot:1896013-Prymnesium_polylepis.1